MYSGIRECIRARIKEYIEKERKIKRKEEGREKEDRIKMGLDTRRVLVERGSGRKRKRRRERERDEGDREKEGNSSGSAAGGGEVGRRRRKKTRRRRSGRWTRRMRSREGES